MLFASDLLFNMAPEHSLIVLFNALHYALQRGKKGCNRKASFRNYSAVGHELNIVNQQYFKHGFFKQKHTQNKAMYRWVENSVA